MKATQTYAEWSGVVPLNARARDRLRNAVIWGLSIGKKIDRSTNWIRFPYYHHVFEDERQNFSRQLKFLQNYGDFISLDSAVSLISAGTSIDGRYFCLTFDDGLKSCLDGALPILAELNIPGTFYLVSGMLGKSLEPNEKMARDVFHFKGRSSTLDFLSWEDCRKMVDAGMTIGSHTVNHTRLKGLSDDQALSELRDSKSEIEKNLGQPCDHFCAPYGTPNTDFDLARHGALAESVGYKTFATGKRGPSRHSDSLFALKRDHMLANWGLYQLKYFLSLD